LICFFILFSIFNIIKHIIYIRNYYYQQYWKKSTQSSKLGFFWEPNPMNCLFCQIAQGAIPADIIYQDDVVIAFNDIKPHAPQHLLIVPKKHISTLNDLETEDTLLVGHMVQTASRLAKENNIAEDGYRLVINCNAGAGQTVFHLHLHLLGGRQLAWPPG